MKKTADFLLKCIIWIFIILTVWINVIIWVHGTRKNLPGTVLAFVISVSAILLVQKAAGRFAGMKSRNRKIGTAVLMILYLFMLLYSGFHLWCDVFDTWDFGFLIRTAYEITFHGTILDPVYYARYPNNTMFLQILCGLCRFAKLIGVQDIRGFLRITVIANCLVIAASAFMLYRTAVIVWGDEAGFLSLVLLMLSWPLTSYSAIAYTDTCALLPFSLILYLSARLMKPGGRGRQWLTAILLGIALTVGYRIRAPLMIALIAILIVMVLFQMKDGAGAGFSLLVIPVLLISVLACSAACRYTSIAFLDRYGVTEEVREAEEFPVTHWIMMSMNPEKDGGYDLKDVLLSASAGGLEERKTLIAGELKNRFAVLGIKGTLYHVLYKKAVRQWMYGSYSTSAYMGRRAINDTWLREFVSVNGRYNRIYRMITQGYYAALMLFALAAGLLRRRCGPFALQIRLILVGVFLFYLLWEVNPRYLLDFHLIFVLLACEGIRSVYRRTAPLQPDPAKR